MALDLPTWITLSALAGFRIAELLVIDEGPFGVFTYFRGFSMRSNPILKTIGQALNCVHCTGLYVSALFGALYFFQSLPVFAVLVIFSIAGVQSVISNRLGRSH